MAEPKGPLAARVRIVLRWLEALGVAAAFGLFRLLPLDLASATGGWVCRRLSPLVPVSRHAERTLRRAFPEKSDAEIRRLRVAMWEHLGRVFGEYPHLARLRLYEPQGRVKVVGVEHADRLREDGKTGIFFSAHIGNWELLAVGATQLGLPLARIYRVPNNPLVDQLMRAARRSVEGELLPKGAKGARRALAIMRAGGHLAMLVDQKMNDGIAVPFFGRPAMTAPALALLAFKFDCPVVPAKVERLEGCRFRLTIYPPLRIERSGERERDVLALMTRVNAIIEGWIRERPEQWLWLHRRWPN